MIGRLLGNRYEITEKIDSGGMAYIYKALCRKTGHTVAVKILKETFSDNDEYVIRFKKEAETTFSLNHVNVVHVMDIGCENGVYYMVMEYIDGETMKALVDRKGRLDEREAVDYTLQVCSALAAAHRKGIIHRDIKPRNILLDSENHIKVTDFGIAMSISNEDTDEHQAIGSVHYVSPEQAKGERVDARSDIYSLGIMLYQMVTGTLPYTGDKTIAVALKHINEPLTPPIDINGNISIALNKIIIKATSKNKRDRYKTMSAMKADLVRALVDPSGAFIEVLTPPSIHSIFPRDHKKNKMWKIGILFVMTAILAVAVIFGADILKLTAKDAIKVPDTVGLTSASACGILKDNGLAADVVYSPSETVADGVVISQTPESDVQMTSGGEVILTVSSGPDDLIMPNVSGMTLEDAQDVILKMGLAMDDVTYESVDDGNIGIVLSQSPMEGDVVADSDTVTLVVSALPEDESAAVPQVVDMPLEQAVSLLADTGFNSCFIYLDSKSEKEEGTVTAQNPGQGLLEPLSSDVDLWISDYQNKPYIGHFEADITIDEVESKVKIVLEDTINGHTANYVISESVEDVGIRNYRFDIECAESGTKTVKVYINNIEISGSEVEFFVRNGID